MTSESQTWHDHVRPVLVTARLDPHRIENAISLGMPDVNYVYGWIELKYAHHWPKRAKTPLRLPHFTPQQRTWLRRRWLLKGLAFVLLRVENDFLLFDGSWAADLLGKVPKEVLYSGCLAHAKLFDPVVFLPILTTSRTR